MVLLAGRRDGNLFCIDDFLPIGQHRKTVKANIPGESIRLKLNLVFTRFKLYLFDDVLEVFSVFAENTQRYKCGLWKEKFDGAS